MRFLFAVLSLQAPSQDALKRRHFVGRDLGSSDTDTYGYDVEAQAPLEVTENIRHPKAPTLLGCLPVHPSLSGVRSGAENFDSIVEAEVFVFR